MKRSPIKFSNPMLKRCEFVTNEGFYSRYLRQLISRILLQLGYNLR